VPWATTGKGHFDPFPPHRPNAGYVIGKETVAWARGSGRGAPKADMTWDFALPLSTLRGFYVRRNNPVGEPIHGKVSHPLMPERCGQYE
jgi:hypothetical protein